MSSGKKYLCLVSSLSSWSSFAKCQKCTRSSLMPRLSYLQKSGSPVGRLGRRRTSIWCPLLERWTRLWSAPRMLAARCWQCPGAQCQWLMAHSLQTHRYTSAKWSQLWKDTCFCWAQASLSSNCFQSSTPHKFLKCCIALSRWHKWNCCQLPPDNAPLSGWSC